MGWGQYSTVWMTRDLKTNKLYALKIQKSATAYMEAAQDELRLFTEVMKHVHQLKEEHPSAVVNIVELQDHFLYTGVNGTHMCFVYERLGPSLLDLIKHYNYRGIPPAIVRPLVHDMLDGLAFLHSCGIIHTDVKPENILLKAPLSDPPPAQTTMYDVIQQEIESNSEVASLRAKCEDASISPEERRKLRVRLKKLRQRIKKNMSNNGVPTLWGFINFNYKECPADSSEKVVEPPPQMIPLTPADWQYPDDCFYIKMYILAPLETMTAAFGPKHRFGEEKREECSEWTFSFDGPVDDEAINIFQIRGHGKDRHTRLHNIRHIIMNDFSIRDKDEHLLWSLRFDGRRIRTVFSILENRIEGFRVIHLPNPKFALSAYEHNLISNASREFLPPATAIFRNVNGVLVGLCIPRVKEGLEILPLEQRLSMWPSDAMMSKTISNDRSIPPFFGKDDVIGCKIVDLGNSCFDNKKFTNDIQTRQYRCPETILHTPYTYSADIWSAACVIFELLTGDFLFQPKEHGNVSKDLDQLSLFEELLGKIPPNFARTGKRWKSFMHPDGKLKYQRPYAPHKIAYRLHKAGLSMDECILVEDLLLQMLQYDPSKRLTARECLSHTWFSFKND